MSFMVFTQFTCHPCRYALRVLRATSRLSQPWQICMCCRGARLPNQGGRTLPLLLLLLLVVVAVCCLCQALALALFAGSVPLSLSFSLSLTMS